MKKRYYCRDSRQLKGFGAFPTSPFNSAFKIQHSALPYFFSSWTFPEKVVMLTTALPSPTTPRMTFRRPRVGSVSEPPIEKSEWTVPLQELASTANPEPPATVTRTFPECDLSS